MSTWIRDPTHYGNLTQAEMENNALCVRDWFYANSDWTINAIAGMVANMQGESRICPDAMERPTQPIGIVGVDGIGLVQWTTVSASDGNPLFQILDYLYNNHNNWEDPDKQCHSIMAEYRQSIGQIPTSAFDFWWGNGDPDVRAQYPLSFTQWAHSTANPGYLALHFQATYERPEVLDPRREQWGNDWYQFLTGHPPTPVPTTRKGLKVWQMIRYHL